MSRVLALDYGDVRIGVALSDPLGLTAQAQPFIPNNDDSLRQIKTVIEDYDVSKLVMGLPKNKEGGDSAKATQVREFAAKIQAENPGLELCFWDERYSTAAVQKRLIDAGVRRDKRKEVVDSLAAAYILEGYMSRFPLVG